ncbi:MAG: hypothetical protein R6W78_07085, partial [Bacteroidales bacterium]
MNHPETIYKERINRFTTLQGKLKKRLAFLSLVRLLVFLLIIFSVFYLVQLSLYPGIAVTLLLLVVFLAQIRKFNTLQREKNKISNLIKINKWESDALQHKYDHYDDGSEFSDPDHPFTNDLDIFGNGSLFQYLNRTSTYTGKQKLAKRLSEPLLKAETIEKNQDAVNELIPCIDQRQDFFASGMMNAESLDDLDEIKDWLTEKSRYIYKKRYHIFGVVFPALSFITITASIINTACLKFVVANFLLQLLITAFNFRHNNRVHARLGKKIEIFKKYDDLLKIIENKTYSSQLLSEMSDKLINNNSSARNNIRRLVKLVSSFDSRLNLLVGTILNGFLLWDIQCMLRLEKWRETHKDNVYEWIELIGDFDMLGSLANFGFNNPGYIFPKPDMNVIIDFTGLGHPLIHVRERVTNDISILSPGEFYIITGANMAGKSTFLRTVAVNLLLAMTGTPVCAKEAAFRPIKIFSSMRTSDSLRKNESYFYAELKRLKALIDRLRSGERLFIVLDEILKGTNSADKQKGSRAVLGQIVKLNGAGLIATHDLDLAEMEKDLPENLKNKCFEIEINGAEIFFDYRLYDGITKKMNASLLM